VRNDWARTQDRRRALIAAGTTVALYCLVFLAIVLVGLLVPSTLSVAQGPLVVDLGLPEGASSSVLLGVAAAPERPAGQPPSPPAAATPSSVAASTLQAAAASAAPPPSAPAKNGASAVSAPPMPGGTSAGGAPRTPPSSGAASSAAPAASSQAAPPPPGSRTFSSSSGTSTQGSAAGSSKSVGSPAGIVGGTGSVTFRGSEMGNALDTTFVAAAGTVGRNLYVPIWLYMPLPSRIDDSTYQAIPADAGGFYTASARKEAFRGYYSQSGAVWTLKSKVPYDARAFLWLMLQDAGYDPAHADFKAGANLRPVSIDFVVGPASPGSKPALVYVDLVSSSGSKEIDEAVLYGFRQATFFNNTGTSVSGHFTYDFNGGQSIQ